MKDPAVLFYTQDFITGTILMTHEQRGKYILLLCLQHQNGKLSEKDLLKICGAKDDDIWCKFERDEQGLFYNKRMLLEAEKRKENSKKQKERIQKYWDERKNHGNTVVLPSEDENENENESVITLPSYRKLFEKILSENDIILPSGFNDLILEWLKYKSEKGQTYKETGLKNFIVKFMNDCEGDYESARAMLLYSISNNYSGLFKEKTNGSVKKLGATKEQLAHLIASTEASDRA